MRYHTFYKVTFDHQGVALFEYPVNGSFFREDLEAARQEFHRSFPVTVTWDRITVDMMS